MKSARNSVLLNWAAVGLWIGAAVAAARRLTPAAIDVVKKRIPLHKKGAAAQPKS